MNPPTVAIEEVHFWERPVRLRLPFRFGVITLTEAPQLFCEVRLRVGGAVQPGFAAEMLIPKWFDKRPGLSVDENIAQLRDSAARARSAALAAGAPQTAWRLHVRVERDCLAAAGADEPGLVTHFGPALLARAVLDALAHATGTGWHRLWTTNLPGLQPADVAADLAGFDAGAWLSQRPGRSRIHARHTVGLVDRLTAAGGAGEASGDDRSGLPTTLDAVARHYRHRYYKLKLSGEVAADVDRLEAICAVLDAARPDWLCTVDGNEQFPDVAPLRELLAAVRSRPRLASLARALRYIEQPVHRDRALAVDLPDLGWPLMIDESDDALSAFPAAVRRGYQGVSSKSCKGIYKALINAMRCEVLNRSRPGHFLSGEDLTMQPGVAVQQDLALVALLGLEHVERNGHFYGDGMATAPAAERDAFVAAHPDLYAANAGRVELRIADGELRFDSLAGPGFARACPPLRP